MCIDFGHELHRTAAYKRELDLDSGIVRVEYEYEGINIQREVLASCPDRVLVVRVRATEATEFAVRVSRLGEMEFETNGSLDDIQVTDRTLAMHVKPNRKGVIAHVA